MSKKKIRKPFAGKINSPASVLLGSILQKTRSDLPQNILCVEQDAFLEDRVMWIAFLSHKKYTFELKVYQDDGRPGLEESVAWKRLWDFCQSTGCYVRRIRIKFRSHSKEVPFSENNSGCYFSYATSKDINSDSTSDYYVLGFLHSDQNKRSGKRIVRHNEPIGELYYAWYSIPDLEIEKSSSRPASNKDVIEKRLIASD